MVALLAPRKIVVENERDLKKLIISVDVMLERECAFLYFACPALPEQK
jgi:hypothetical protein